MRQDGPERFSLVIHLPNQRAFVVQFENGKGYLLPVDDLAGSDSSPVARWRIGRGRRHFTVVQQSGNSFEVPWDAVLYHAEPEYEYYKGKPPPDETRDRAERIGRRLRLERTRRGLAISELADQAGLLRPNLSHLEHGRHEPSLDTLERIARALHVPVARLVTP